MLPTRTRHKIRSRSRSKYEKRVTQPRIKLRIKIIDKKIE